MRALLEISRGPRGCESDTVGDLISSPYLGVFRWRIEERTEAEFCRRRGSLSEQVIDMLILQPVLGNDSMVTAPR